MDPKIKALKSTTFLGRRFTRRQIAEVQELVEIFPNDSRNELAKIICNHLNWLTPKGGYRIAAALRFLERLESCEIVTLPELRNTVAKSSHKPIAHIRASDPQPQITEKLADLEPLNLQQAQSADDIELFNALLDRYHYLGCPKPFGPCIRWILRDQNGRHLAVLLFEAAARTLPVRDKWVGWTTVERERRLHLAVSNSRFLILPWVRVDNLASKTLAMATRRLADHWQEQHACRPVLCETFIDPTRFDGACYRACGWEDIGMTAGKRSGTDAKPAKTILVQVLEPNFREQLKGQAKAQPKKQHPTPPKTSGSDDSFIAMWSQIIDAATDIAARYDKTWIKRRRTLNSLLIMLFVFRLVMSDRQKSYTTLVAELWDNCRKLNITLPQSQPVVASSICKARSRLHEDLFRDLHREILAHDTHNPNWNGHRTFAVDGSKLNLPRPLVKDGYPLPNSSTHYPQGLLSCLYRLNTQMPVDFILTPNACERTAACTHLNALSPGDVVVFDRGYFSFALLHKMIERQLNPVFRIQRSSVLEFKRFQDGNHNDACVTITASDSTQRNMAAAGLSAPDTPIRLRLLRYEIDGSRYLLATTLIDQDRYSLKALSSLYHDRWSIEELYKLSKHRIKVERFHGQSERAVRQEVYAQFNLIAMARLFTNQGDRLLSEQQDSTRPKMQTNVSHALSMLFGSLEEMLLTQAAALAETVDRVAQRILKVRSRLRPGRSYPRISKQPRDKWSSERKAKN